MENSGKKILIVDDERPMVRALELKLGHAGFTVKSVFDGDEALAALANEKYDLILLDLIMPKKDGFAVLEDMKAKNNGTPVIVLSNLGQKEDVQRARIMGARGYIIKSNATLLEIVNQVKKTTALWSSTIQK